jgi:hypothetical protein
MLSPGVVIMFVLIRLFSKRETERIFKPKRGEEKEHQLIRRFPNFACSSFS